MHTIVLYLYIQFFNDSLDVSEFTTYEPPTTTTDLPPLPTEPPSLYGVPLSTTPSPVYTTAIPTTTEEIPISPLEVDDTTSKYTSYLVPETTSEWHSVEEDEFAKTIEHFLEKKYFESIEKEASKAAIDSPIGHKLTVNLDSKISKQIRYMKSHEKTVIWRDPYRNTIEKVVYLRK